MEWHFLGKKKKIYIFQVTFNTGLALTGFRTTQPRRLGSLIQGYVSSATAHRELLQRQTKNTNQIDNLFIKPKTKLGSQPIHPHETRSKASLIDAVSLHDYTVQTLCCITLHQLFVIRSSPSFQEPPVRKKTDFFKKFYFQMPSSENNIHSFIFKNVVFPSEGKNSFFSVEFRLKIF